MFTMELIGPVEEFAMVFVTPIFGAAIELTVGISNSVTCQ